VLVLKFKDQLEVPMLERFAAMGFSRTAIDLHAVLYCFPAVLFGYAALAAPGRMGDWAAFGAIIFLAVGACALGARFLTFRHLKTTFYSGVASGGALVKTAAVIHVFHLIVWRVLIAAAGLAVAFGLLYFFGVRWWSIVLASSSFGGAFLTVTSFARIRVIELALGALQPPVSIRGRAACQLVFWPPARSARLRALDGRLLRPPGEPSRLAMLQANLSRYRDDGRGPLPPSSEAFRPDDRCEARAAWAALLGYLRHLLPILLLFAVLGFPLSDAASRWTTPYIPFAPFSFLPDTRDERESEDSPEPAAEAQPRLPGLVDGGSSGGSRQGGDTNNAGSVGGTSGSAGSGERVPDGPGPQSGGAGVADAGGNGGSGGAGANSEGGSENAEAGTGAAGAGTGETNPLGTGGPSSEQARDGPGPQSGGAGVADAGGNEGSGGAGANSEGESENAEAGTGAAGAGTGETNPLGTGEPTGEQARDGPGPQSGGAGVANAGGNESSSGAGANSEGGSENAEAGTGAAGAGTDGGEREQPVRETGPQAGVGAAPPPLDPSKAVEPASNDDFFIKGVATLYGAKGGVPETLRVFRISDPALEDVPERTEARAPTQTLPAWIGAVIRSSTIE
jgi:hypothetical protein